MLGLEVPGNGYALKQGRLSLVPGIVPLSKRYEALGDQLLLVWDLWNFEPF